jgi:CRP-like cAMP-binding protein
MALAGAAVLALAVPASLGVMALAVARAVRAFLPARADEGEHTGRPAEVDLDAVPLFLRLSPEDRIALTRAAQVRRFPPGSRIVVQGEAGDRFYAIRSGEVVVERELDSGVRKEVARLGPGDCFGETALLERTPRTATVRALGEVSALVLSQQDFARVQGDLAGAEVTQLLRASAGLHQSALFSHLAKDRLSALAMQLKACAVAAGEVVVQEGDEGDTFYLVESGALEVSVDGKTIATLGPGQHFGEVALLRDVARTATIRALEPSLVLTLDKKRFIAAVASDLSVSARLEEVAAKRVEATR